jgi:hypothetical protein
MHCASSGFTDFVRIELALDLEPHFQQKALMNQQAGGENKGLSKLTIAQRVNTRLEVARLARVSSGNVRKVKNILTHACSSLLLAARDEEVSINLADKWCLEPKAQQQEFLRVMRIQGGIERKARNVLAEHLRRVSPQRRDRQVIQLADLVGRSNDLGSIEIEIINAPGRKMLATKELIDWLTAAKGIAHEW